MHKGPSYFRLLAKKMRRTIFRSPLQFLTMVLILGLASTLLSGLYASHLSFEDQINRVYAESNIADITSTLTYDYNDADFDPSEMEQDYQLIKECVGEDGTVEGQFNTTGIINSQDAYIAISDSFPTINKPTEINGKAENDNYFLFSSTYLTNPMGYGEKSSWINDDGSYKPLNLSVSNSNLKNRIKDSSSLKTNLDKYVKDQNILFDDYLTLSVTPTGDMIHPENIVGSASQPFTLITTRKFMKSYLKEALESKYDIKQLKKDLDNAPEGKEKEQLQECYDLLNIDDNHNEIMSHYWGNNRYLTRLDDRNDAVKYRDKINAAFKRKTSSNLLLNIQLADSTANQELNTDVTQSLQLCYVFPPIFFLVSILIVLTTISQIILKERKEIGTLKAIGASNRSILIYYIALAGIIALIGIALGVAIGPFILPMILNVKYKILYTLPAYHYIFPAALTIIMTFVVLIITTLVVYLIARKEIKSLPVVSMRPKAVDIKNKNITESKKDNTHKLCYKMAKRNIFCSIPRSIMVIVGVLGCTALLCCGFGIDDSIQSGFDNDTNTFFNTDSIIYFSNPSTETFEAVQNLKSDDGESLITDFEPYGIFPVTSSIPGVINKSYSCKLYSIPSDIEQKLNFFNFGYEGEGKKIMAKENKIIISTQVAENLNVKVGDWVNFEFLGKTYNGTIARVIDIFYMNGIYIDGLYPQFPSYMFNSAYARFNPNFDQKYIIDKIEETQGVSFALDKAALTQQIRDISSSLSYITLTIKIFAILLAIVSIYNLALLNFKENVRNIATMKVLGFNRREVAESLFFEIITLTIVGALIGLTLGYPLARLTLSINKVPICYFFYYLGPASVFISLFITLGVSAVINAFVGARNKHVKMVESLKSIE